jgi:hypothetical protein
MCEGSMIFYVIGLKRNHGEVFEFQVHSDYKPQHRIQSLIKTKDVREQF